LAVALPHRRVGALAASCLAIEALAQSPDQPDSTLANPLEAQSLDRLSATRDRPLFSPSRRPVPPPPPPVEQAAAPIPPPPPPNVKVFGIVLDDEGARAIVRTGTEKVDRVQIGDHIGGWTVSQIEGRYLVLSLDGRFAKFTLFTDEGGKQSPGDTGAPAETLRDQTLRDQTSQQTTPQGPQAGEQQSRRRRRSRQ